MGYQHRPFKWAALMLPEHKERLEELKVSQDDVAPPQVDEQQREAMSRALGQALLERRAVAVRYWRARRTRSAEGWVVGCGGGVLTLRDKDGRSVRLQLTELTDLLLE